MEKRLILKKRLLIMYNEGVENTQSYLKGVLSDVENYQLFFKSLEGGAWNKTEMKVFHKPSLDELSEYVDENTDSDYFLIVFCGQEDSRGNYHLYY